MTDNYHSGIDRVTSSGLKMILNQTPAHYYAKYAKAVGDTPTTARVLGSVIHSLVLEGDDITLERYGNAPANPGTQKYAAWLEEEEGMLGGLKPEDWGKAYDIRDSLYQVKSLRDMLETGGKAEEVIEWTDPITGAPCKAKPDWVSNDGKLMIDLKSSRDASPLGFAKAVRNYDYDLSAAMYLIGAEEALGVRPRWLWVVVENTAPYAPAIYEMSPATRATGEEKMYQALEVYEKCRRSGVWPGYENGVI